MDSQKEWKTAQTNTPLARSFRSIVTAGWANRSNGEVDSPFGHFALVLIEPNELQELTDACLEEDDIKPYPGAYIVVEDSGGNTSLHEYLHNKAAESAFKRLSDAYDEWLERDDV